ncbi:MAG: HDOD domain-containing protein [Planctomycetes bacterium]|nr:HDOD domain-containing protein [Planctomycetota bacterium]
MTVERTLLFVDDEPRIIDGIKRMMRPLRDDWGILTATSGPEALRLLAENHVDVVISDMRMPGMDGAELLDRVMRDHPNVVRIILSGQSDSESIMRSIGPTHQYLSKPCAPEVLRATIARACSIRDLLCNAGLAAIISRLSSLPSMPNAYGQVIAELQAPQPSLPNIARIIADDIGMSAKILQLVNFSMIRGGRTVASPIEATMALGLENIRSLVLTVRVFEQADEPTTMFELWQHGRLVGSIAKAIAVAEQRRPDEAEMCYTAGMLHDCGRLILCARLESGPAEGDAVRDLTGMERAKFGAAHSEIGAYLLGLWGLPFPIVEAVAHHHHPEAFPGTGFTPLTAVHVAEALMCEQLEYGVEGAVPAVSIPYLTSIGLADRLPAWRTIASQIIADFTRDGHAAAPTTRSG